MASPVKTYQREMKDFGYRATWEPNLRLELGAYGMLHAGAFIQYGHLTEDFDIQIDRKSSPGGGSIEHSTEGAVTFTSKAAGETAGAAKELADVDAGIIIEFEKGKAVAFKANGTTNHSIRNMAQVERAVVELERAGTWNDKHVFISELIEADTTTVLISQSSGSKAEIKAEGSLNAGSVDIADAEAQLSLVSSSKLETKIVGAKSLTPLYKVMGLKKNWFGRVKEELVTRGDEPEDALEERGITREEFEVE